jgi:hypothetical protein
MAVSEKGDGGSLRGSLPGSTLPSFRVAFYVENPVDSFD